MIDKHEQGAAASNARRFNRRAVIAAGMAVAGLGTVSPVLGQSDANPLKSSPEPTTGAGPEGLVSLLAFVPDHMLSGESEIHWYYADLAQQFASLNLHHDANGLAWDDEPWVPATLTLSAASAVFRFARVEDILEIIGFQPLGVNQTLLVGEPPNQLTLFRGDFSRPVLEAAWEANGYEEKTSESGVAVWTIGEEGEFDISHPVQAFVFAAFNNVALVDDVLVYASTMAMLEDALATKDPARGRQRSIRSWG